jgi:tetratricopeptide (TPR) repeat protein
LEAHRPTAWKRLLAAFPQDTSRLPVLTDILRATVFTDPDRAVGFAEQYRSLAKENGSTLHQAKGDYFLGMCYSMKGEQAAALTHYLQALQGFEQAGETWYTAMSNNNIGSIHLDEKRLDKAREAVQDSRQRVKSMALIHQDLYRDGDLTGVQMNDYVEKLATSLITSYAMSDRIELRCDVQDLSLDADTAVPLGLILNELITNALK